MLSVTDNRAKPLMNQLVVRVSSLSFSPHLCVGFLFLILYPGSASRPPSPVRLPPPAVTHHLSHTIFVSPSFTHHLCQPPSLSTIFVNQHLSHISLSTIFVHHHLSHAIFHTHTIFHTPSLSHHLSHAIFPTPSLSTIIFHHFVTHIFVTHLHPPPFRVAGVALGDIYFGFAWQAWRLATSTLVLRRAWARISFLFPAFPVPCSTFFWLLIGRSWHMGLSGPLTFHPLV